MTSKQSLSSDDPYSQASNVPKSGAGGQGFGLFRISASTRFWLAVLFVLSASAFAFMQSPRTDVLRAPRRFLSTGWWRYPLEWSAMSRLAKVETSLYGIQAVPNTTSVWAVGNKGMVITSSDGGITWSKRGIETGQIATTQPNSPESATSPSPSPSPSPPLQPMSFLNYFDPVPTVSAQKPFDPRTQTGTPTPTPTSNAKATPTPAAFSQPSPETEKLIAVYFVDENHGEAVSNSGWRYTSPDSGAHWTPSPLKNHIPWPAATTTELPMRSLQLPPLDSESGEFLVVSKSGVTRIFSNGRFTHGFMKEVGSNWISYTGPILPPVNAAFILPKATQSDGTSPLAWLIGSAGTVYRTREQRSWEKLVTQTPDDLYGAFFTNANRGWVVGSNGAIFTTNDSGTTWTKQTSNTTTQLNAVHFMSDGQHGWIAGNDGLVLSTNNGGATWIHRTQGIAGNGGTYLRFPAPWYFVGLLLVGLMVWRRPKGSNEPAEESVADVLVSDRPLQESTGDVLAFTAIARGLSRFLRNENTLPPLTIAITGEWGTGKSSLMNLLRADLRSYKFRPVWFNAWHHQKEEHMLASLLENIKLQAVPRWWTMRGLLFRAHLLRIRGWRHWGPLALLVFFIYVMAVYQFVHHGTETNLAAFLKSLPAPFSDVQTTGTGRSFITLLPLVAGIVTFAGALWRGITAFGVKPASLLAGVSRGVSIRGLEAQTSFRQKFALEFSDVTRALGERSMLIFIDDLDRCRPENVLETLEAVNFLTTSGDCFVVIGMAREYVERCVGRAFNEVAQEMVDDLQDECDEPAEHIAKLKRIEFARQYLDKLINIEVPVPAPKQSQSLALLVASTRDRDVGVPASSWQRLRLAVVSFAERRWRVVPTLILTGGLLVLGFYLARGMAGESGFETALGFARGTGPVPSPEPSAAPMPQATPESGGTPLPTPTPTALPTPNSERSIIVAGQRAFVSPGVLPVLALLALILLGVAILTRRPGLVVKDSPRFVAALQIWHPLVFSRQHTPRATKRFMNFVRYLAMRQRRQNDNQAPLKELLARLRARLVGVKTTGAVTNTGSTETQIPDEVLVALAALQHVNPDCLKELPGPVSDPDWVWPRVSDGPNTLFDTAQRGHELKFGNWVRLSQYREKFLEMTANVRVQ